MNKLLATLILAAIAAPPAFAEVNVGVSIGIRQPGVYGRIDIGDLPPPPVIYAQPVIIVPRAVEVQEPPMYLYVPPGQQRNWRKHCRRYGACGRQVYFVEERWVAERYEERHGRGHGRGGKGKRGGDHDRGHDRHDD